MSDHAISSAKGWLESILEMVAALENADDYSDARENAERRIRQSVLSVEVRDGWRTVGASSVGPEEFMLLLSTGGPALRMIGSLDANNEPDDIRLEWQDWGVPWTEYREARAHRDKLAEFARCFYWGE
jgi:hypothetical protein